MIVFCPEAFISQVSGKNVNWLEKGFIEFFVLEVRNKNIIANEIWETFRLKMMANSPNKEEAIKSIASFRGIFKPEEIFLDENYQEKVPEQEYSKTIMVEKTKDLITRNHIDIEIIITSNEKEYNQCSKDIPCRNIEGFFIHCMSIPRYRNIVEKYLRIIEYKKASGEQ